MTVESRHLDVLLGGPGRVHFVGVAGVGMSALAEHRARGGLPTSGSDRAFDRGQQRGDRVALEGLGVALFAQDGSGVRDAALVVTSTAVEAAIPDLEVAGELGIPTVHRSEMLAVLARTPDAIAIAGTSGKSTVVAMVFEILRAAGMDPGVITGGALRCLTQASHRGHAWRGTGPLVFEACESDKSLVRYEVDHGVVLNLHRDHDDVNVMLPIFEQFRGHLRKTAVVGDDAELASLWPGATTAGLGERASVRPTGIAMSGTGSTFTLEGVSFELGLPGAHHIHDAVCAVAVTRGIGVSLIDAARALAVFQGVARRFESLGSADGVEIIDDYAHNPAKIAASVTAAHLRAKRVIAVFQPHGFGPTRFMRDELIERLDAVLGPTDAAVFLPIYFAGGTVTRDIESDDLAKDLVRRGRDARVVGRDALPAHLCRVASAGDVILVMGARDPRLGELARAVRAALHDRAADSGRDRAETANEGPA